MRHGVVELQPLLLAEAREHVMCLMAVVPRRLDMVHMLLLSGGWVCLCMCVCVC